MKIALVIPESAGDSYAVICNDVDFAIAEQHLLDADRIEMETDEFDDVLEFVYRVENDGRPPIHYALDEEAKEKLSRLGRNFLREPREPIRIEIEDEMDWCEDLEMEPSEADTFATATLYIDGACYELQAWVYDEYVKAFGDHNWTHPGYNTPESSTHGYVFRLVPQLPF